MSAPDVPGANLEDRPMSAYGASWWTLLITLGFIFLWSALSPLTASHDMGLALAGASQVVAYALGVVGLRAVYAPRTDLSSLVALRRTRSRALLLIAPVLGFALSIPANALFSAILERYPVASNGTIDEAFSTGQPVGQALIVLSTVLLGPAVEELIFRGILFTLVERYARLAHPFSLGPMMGAFRQAMTDEPTSRQSGPPRASAAMDTIAISSGLFALVHFEWQRGVPIVFMGVLLGVLRVRSGSIVPGILVHIGFNAAPFVAMMAVPDWETVPPTVVALGTLISVALVAISYYLSSSDAPVSEAET